MHFFDIWTSKSALNLCVLCILTWKCASHHNGVNFQKWPEPVSFWHFWLGNVLRATTACTFSTSQLPKVVRTWGVFSFFSSKRASRHNGVQFFISHPAALASLLFDPPEPQIIGKKHSESTTFLPFRAPASSFFSDLLTSFLLLSDSSHLCFSNCPYCRKFHFKTSFDERIINCYYQIGDIPWCKSVTLTGHILTTFKEL